MVNFDANRHQFGKYKFLSVFKTESHINRNFCFYRANQILESLILAQDERWRRV